MTWNPRDHHVGVLNLCLINTPDGPFRFILGEDGVFTDVNGNEWIGSTLLTVPRLQSAIDGIAPAGEISLPFFHDPASENDLIAEVQRLGRAYIDGYTIEFYHQPIRTTAEFYAPGLPPVLDATRVMREIAYSGQGGEERSITLTYEAMTEDRRSRRRIAYNTEGHARLIGQDNPSLEFIPTFDFEEEKLFG